jgi:hypothetical protein
LGWEPVFFIPFLIKKISKLARLLKFRLDKKQIFPNFSKFFWLKIISCKIISTHIPYLGLYDYLPHQNNVSFIGKFSPKLNDLKNMIVTYTKDFFSLKMDQICQISKKRKIQIAKFLVGSQEYKKVLFF